MTTLKHWRLLLLIVITGLIASHCQATPWHTVPTVPRPAYFLAATSPESEEHRQFINGMQAALSEVDHYFDFQYQALPETLNEQQALIQHIAQIKDSVIFLHCLSIQPLADTLQAAAEQGSTIVLVDSPQLSSLNSLTIGNSPYNMGESLATKIMQTSTQPLTSAEMVLVHHTSTGETSNRRIEGAQFQFKVNWQQPAQTLTLAGSHSEARQQLALFIANNPEIKAVLCLDEFATTVAPEPFHTALPNTTIYGIGVNPTILSAMEKNFLSELIVPNSYSIGYTAIKRAYQQLTTNSPINNDPNSVTFYRSIHPNELFDLGHAAWLFPYTN